MSLGQAGNANWSESREFCKNINGTLATISNDVVKHFVQTSELTWIGAFRPPGVLDLKAGWKWDDGTPWEFESWISGEPDGVGWTFSQQDCAVLSNMKWYDTPCTDARPFVCQKKCKGICLY